MISKLIIVTGHYGSGKTEFATNLAIVSKTEQIEVSISDLDIVNPYFRSREKSELFRSKGIKVHDSSLSGANADVPAMSPTILSAIQGSDSVAILDVGGDSVGARVLCQFERWIKDKEYELYFVVNGNRPETQNAIDVIKYIDSIESVSNLKVTGLVNNTHLLKATSVSDLKNGAVLCEEVSKITNIPVIYHCVMKSLVSAVEDESINEKLFPLTIYMREDWMS